MHRFYAARVIDSLQIMHEFEPIIRENRNEPGIGPSTLKIFTQMLDAAIESFAAIELQMTEKSAQEAKRYIRKTKEANEHFEQLLADTRRRCRDELELKLIFCLASETARYFPKDDEPLFGQDVHEKFRKRGQPEISEAGKCLALDRPTACVFHLMRAVEVAIEAVRACLQMPPPTRDQHKAWGAVLASIRTELDQRENLAYRNQWSSTEDRKLFEGLHMSLVAIKDGCRDDTMHVESTYPVAEAEHLFALSKGFMRKVASRLDEDGQPLA